MTINDYDCYVRSPNNRQLHEKQLHKETVLFRSLYYTLPWLSLALLDSSTVYHGSTWLYLTLLRSTMALLGSTWVYLTLPHSTMALYGFIFQHKQRNLKHWMKTVKWLHISAATSNNGYHTIVIPAGIFFLSRYPCPEADCVSRFHPVRSFCNNKSGNRIARSCVLSALSRVVIFAASWQLLTLEPLIVTHVFKYIFIYIYIYTSSHIWPFPQFNR